VICADLFVHSHLKSGCRW